MISTPRRADRGQGSLEYLAAIAVAAVLVITVAAAALAQHSGVGSTIETAVCKLITFGTGACGRAPGPEGGSDQDSLLCTTFGWGCTGRDDASDDDRPWYCDLFGVGCPDDHGDDSGIDIPDGLDPDSAMVQTMLATERGRQTLQWLADHDIPIRIDPDQRGAYWDGSEIVLGGGNEDAPTLVHEANHARYAEEGRSADPEDQSRDDYVSAAIAEEADGVVQQIRAALEFRDAGHDVAAQPGEPQYTEAYDQAITDGKSRAEAEQAGLQAVTRLFYSGGFTTSTTGQSYPDYYGSFWDSVN